MHDEDPVDTGDDADAGDDRTDDRTLGVVPEDVRSPGGDELFGGFTEGAKRFAEVDARAPQLATGEREDASVARADSDATERALGPRLSRAEGGPPRVGRSWRTRGCRTREHLRDRTASGRANQGPMSTLMTPPPSAVYVAVPTSGAPLVPPTAPKIVQLVDAPVVQSEQEPPSQ